MCIWANKRSPSCFHSDLFACIGPHPVTSGKDLGDFLPVFMSVLAPAGSLYHTRDASETQTSSCWHYASPGKSEPFLFS